MAHVTVYLDDSTERRAKKSAKSAGMSVSRWISNLIREKTETSWPQAVLALAGAWPDFPTAEELRSTQPVDRRREEL